MRTNDHQIQIAPPELSCSVQEYWFYQLFIPPPVCSTLRAFKIRIITSWGLNLDDHTPLGVDYLEIALPLLRWDNSEGNRQPKRLGEEVWNE